MLRKEDFMVIHALAQRGLYVCDIAKQVGVHPRTVRRAWPGAELQPRGPAAAAVDWIPIGPRSTGYWPRMSGTRW